jgi:hypothetical protein
LLEDLAFLYEVMGDSTEAEKAFLSALEVVEATVGELDPYLEETLTKLADFYFRQGSTSLRKRSTSADMESKGHVHRALSSSLWEDLRGLMLPSTHQPQSDAGFTSSSNVGCMHRRIAPPLIDSGRTE